MTNPATAPAMTYDSLVSDIASYAERTDANFTSQIPRFIMMGENRIASEVRGLGLLKVASGVLTVGVPTIAKPARWRENASFRIVASGQKKALQQRSYEYCQYYAPDPTVQDVPRYYADYGYEHFFIAPSPAAAYPFELMYYERPDPLSPSQETSWTTQYAPQLILFASLLEAMPWLKNDERIPVFQGYYAQAVAAVTAESKRRMYDQSAVGSQ
jgi:hypothetical protein